MDDLIMMATQVGAERVFIRAMLWAFLDKLEELAEDRAGLARDLRKRAYSLADGFEMPSMEPGDAERLREIARLGIDQFFANRPKRPV